MGPAREGAEGSARRGSPLVSNLCPNFQWVAAALQERDGDDECLLDRFPNNSRMRRMPLNLNQSWWWESRGDLLEVVGQERRGESSMAKS